MSMDTAEPRTSKDAPVEPIIIDFGTKSRKYVRRLRKGKPGKLMSKLQEVMQEMRGAGVLPASVQPIVVVVRERPRKDKLGKLLGFG